MMLHARLNKYCKHQPAKKQLLRDLLPITQTFPLSSARQRVYCKSKYPHVSDVPLWTANQRKTCVSKPEKNKHIYISALCWLWIPSRALAKCYGQQWRIVSVCVSNTCCWHAFIMMGYFMQNILKAHWFIFQWIIFHLSIIICLNRSILRIPFKYKWVTFYAISFI